VKGSSSSARKTLSYQSETSGGHWDEVKVVENRKYKERRKERHLPSFKKRSRG